MEFLLFPRLENQIAVQNERERQARPVGQRRLNIQAAINQAVADHRKPIRRTATDGLHEIVLVP